MFKKRYSILALLIATAMFFVSCGSDKKEVSKLPEPELPLTSKQITDLGIWGELNANDSLIADAVEAHQLPFTNKKDTKLSIGKSGDPCVVDFNTNDFTLYLEDRTGIELDIVEFSGDAVKVALAADSDDLPDIGMYGLSDAQFLQYGQSDVGSGALIPWDFYFENYGYYYKSAIANTQISKIDNFLVAPDGHRYTVPYICEQMGNMFSGKAWINVKWLDKLGLRHPTKDDPYTTEELRTVLTKFANNDPNGNGKKDEIALTGSSDGYKANPWQFIMNSFIYCDKGDYMWVDDSGNLTYIYQSEDFKDGIRYIRGLVKDGLMQKESIVQRNADLKAISCAENNMIGVLVGGSPDNVFSAKLERMRDYIPLPQPVGPKGVKLPYMQMMVPTYMGWMTRNCEHPLAAYALLDFMMSEEATTFARYGVEGRDWRRATDSEKSNALFNNIGINGDIISILGYGEVSNAHWQAQNTQFRSPKIADGMVWDGDPNDGEKKKADAITAYYLDSSERAEAQKHIVRKLKFENLEDMQEYATLSTGLKKYVNEQVVKYISGELDVDADWSNFQSQLSSMNVGRCRELAQKGYDYIEK